MDVVASTSKAHTGAFCLIHITSINEMRRVGSSLKPRLGSCFRHSSPSTLPRNVRFLSLGAIHTKHPVILPNRIRAF